MFFVDRMAAVLKPTDVFLAWLQQYDEDFADLTLAQLRELQRVPAAGV